MQRLHPYCPGAQGSCEAAALEKILSLPKQLHVQVAVIKWAGTEKQQVWQARIGSIVDDLQGESLSPCIIVVGQVTQLASLTT